VEFNAPLDTIQVISEAALKVRGDELTHDKPYSLCINLLGSTI